MANAGRAIVTVTLPRASVAETVTSMRECTTGVLPDLTHMSVK